MFHLQTPTFAQIRSCLRPRAREAHIRATQIRSGRRGGELALWPARFPLPDEVCAERWQDEECDPEAADDDTVDLGHESSFPAVRRGTG